MYISRKMKTRILWLLTVSALLLSPSALFAQNFDAYGFAFDAANLSHCWVKNVSNIPIVKGCIVQGMRDPANPISLGQQVSRLLQPGESQELTYAVRTDVCGDVQIDGLDNLQPWQTAITAWTESDIHNNHVSALGQMVQILACVSPPPTPTTPVTPAEPPSCPTYTYNIGGSPYIARFPPGYVNPFYPTMRGPFYMAVPSGRYYVDIVTGDNHVTVWDANGNQIGPAGKNDGPQNEIGYIRFSNGGDTPATKKIPEFENSVTTTFRVNLLTDITYFYFVHAAKGPVTEPTDSFYPELVRFRCVE